MAFTETILTVKNEPTETIFGNMVVRITRQGNGSFEILGSKKIGIAETKLQEEVGTSIKVRRSLPAERVTEIINELHHLTIPAVPEFGGGCDGAYTELIIGGYNGKAHYRWLSCPPQGWERLNDFAQEIMGMSGIDELLEERRNRSNK